MVNIKKVHDYNSINKIYNSNDSIKDSLKFFNNLIRAKQLAEILGISVTTIYDWKYRGQTRNVPPDLFKKLGGTLYVRIDILLNWMSYRNSSFS